MLFVLKPLKPSAEAEGLLKRILLIVYYLSFLIFNR